MPDIFVAETKNTTSVPKEKIKEPEKDSVKVGKKTRRALDETEVHSPIHLFSSFSKEPEDMTFQNQEEDETILFFVRKHFITNFPWVILGLFFLIVPFFVGPLSSILNISFTFLPIRFFLFFTLFYYLIVLSYIFVNFITWYFNIALVTNIRVMDVDFRGLVYKNIAVTKISLVQDVSYDQIGVLRTLFDYGEVFVQTAGTMENFTFEAVPQPEKIVHLIGELIGKENNNV